MSATCVANRGPLLFRQPRTGRNGATFEILKFRTMREHVATITPTDWTADTTIRGHAASVGVLRRTHLDELPQVLNILRGDLVGRRAPTGAAPRRGRARRQDPVLPAPSPRAPRAHRLGAGEVPVRGHRGATTLEKLQYEFFYLRRQSLGLDLRIVGRTLRSVVGREGR